MAFLRIHPWCSTGLSIHIQTPIYARPHIHVLPYSYGGSGWSPEWMCIIDMSINHVKNPNTSDLWQGLPQVKLRRMARSFHSPSMDANNSRKYQVQLPPSDWLQLGLLPSGPPTLISNPAPSSFMLERVNKCRGLQAATWEPLSQCMVLLVPGFPCVYLSFLNFLSPQAGQSQSQSHSGYGKHTCIHLKKMMISLFLKNTNEEWDGTEIVSHCC